MIASGWCEWRVLVSRTVRDLVVGSGLQFEDRGEHMLKGIPDRWRIYRAIDPPRRMP
jgi:class 3 adenylate cyclase